MQSAGSLQAINHVKHTGDEMIETGKIFLLITEGKLKFIPNWVLIILVFKLTICPSAYLVSYFLHGLDLKVFPEKKYFTTLQFITSIFGSQTIIRKLFLSKFLPRFARQQSNLIAIEN